MTVQVHLSLWSPLFIEHTIAFCTRCNQRHFHVVWSANDDPSVGPTSNVVEEIVILFASVLSPTR